MKILSKNDQRGRSMVEMLGVLAIIGVLSVGGISGYSKAMAKFKLTKAQDQISMLLMNVRTAFATSPSYEGLNNGNAVAFAIAPGDMYKGTISQSASVHHLNNAFGGEAHIFSCDKNSATNFGASSNFACYGITSGNENQFFAIAMSDLGREACVSLLSSDWGTDGLISVQVIKESAATVKSFDAQQLPIGMMEAGLNCGKYGEKSAIVWTYY